MPSFDVVSEVDNQEVRNAVDQAARELATRYDFKGTDSAVELKETEIELRSVSEDRLNAVRQVLEEKLVKRKVSLKVLDYGKVEDAAGGTVRQVATSRPASRATRPASSTSTSRASGSRASSPRPRATSSGSSARSGTTSRR